MFLRRGRVTFEHDPRTADAASAPPKVSAARGCTGRDEAETLPEPRRVDGPDRGDRCRPSEQEGNTLGQCIPVILPNGHVQQVEHTHK